MVLVVEEEVPPRLKMPVNDGKVAPVLHEEDFGCGRRRRNIDEEVLAQLKKQVGGAASLLLLHGVVV